MNTNPYIPEACKASHLPQPHQWMPHLQSPGTIYCARCFEPRPKELKDHNRIRTLEDLDQCALDRVSVCTTNLICGRRFLPAAFVINKNARQVLTYLRNGLYIYKPAKPRK